MYMLQQFIKQNVAYNEYFIHSQCISLLKDLSQKEDTFINIHIPNIISYDKHSKILILQKIHGDNLSNIYGEEIQGVPLKLIKIIREFLYLLNQYMVEYIDITGYNFMLDKNENLWIIDFEHAKCKNKNNIPNPFLHNFINGELSWNPEFK
jgi:tRNA A-37 threonylcarbamoyl transferase component Bud32